VAPGMGERRHGCIVNGLPAGRVANTPQAPYAPPKWAFEALSECLAQEMKAFNVRVAIVEPGVIATPIFTKANTLPKDALLKRWTQVPPNVQEACAEMGLIIGSYIEVQVCVDVAIMSSATASPPLQPGVSKPRGGSPRRAGNVGSREFRRLFGGYATGLVRLSARLLRPCAPRVTVDPTRKMGPIVISDGWIFSRGELRPFTSACSHPCVGWRPRSCSTLPAV
jgi:hypothetical protein